MFNLQTLTAKARELRGNVVKAASTKGSRTMTPVYDRDEQRKLRERIQQTQPDWVLLWWDIATVSEIQLDQAIDVLEQVGDYMRVNNVSPKILSTGDAIRSINTDNASFWHRTK